MKSGLYCMISVDKERTVSRTAMALKKENKCFYNELRIYTYMYIYDSVSAKICIVFITLYIQNLFIKNLYNRNTASTYIFSP